MCYQLVFIFISLKETNTCLYVYVCMHMFLYPANTYKT